MFLFLMLLNKQIHPKHRPAVSKQGILHITGEG